MSRRMRPVSTVAKLGQEGWMPGIAHSATLSCDTAGFGDYSHGQLSDIPRHFVRIPLKLILTGGYSPVFTPALTVLLPLVTRT